MNKASDLFATTSTSIDELILSFARRSRRGIPVNDLIIELQDYRYKIELLDRDPELAIGFSRDSHFSTEEWISQHRIFFQANIDAILTEIERRRAMKLVPGTNIDPEIIQTIKSRLPVADVLEIYTEVFYSSKDRMRYRCPLHGDGNDKDPAGVIYVRDGHCHCFACNKNFDVFDVVQAFEGCGLAAAIAKLAQYLGLDTRPLINTRVPRITGGAIL